MITRQTASFAKQEAKRRFDVRSLLSVDSDPKTSKSNKLSSEYLTAIQYIAPASLGGGNVCPWATPGCLASCLHTAGNPVYFEAKQRARLNRKALYLQDRTLYLMLLASELERCRKYAHKRGRKLAVRLNGTSDIVWEKVAPELFTHFSDVVFYDYTKSIKRVSSEWSLPSNYDLTLSRSETNHAECLEVLNQGARVSIVFDTKRTKPLPRHHEGHRVHDGDLHDMTFLRPSGWLGLRAKGDARKDTSGFVVEVTK